MFARWVEAEQGRFTLLLPIAMGVAILVYFSLPAEPPLWLGPVATGLSAIALATSWRHQYARFAAAMALMASLGFARAELRTASAPPMPLIPSGVLKVAGIISRIELMPGAARITLTQPRLDSGPPLKRQIRLKLRPSDTTPLIAGEGVQTYAMLFGPERPAYPGGWDQGRDDFFSGLNASGFALTGLTITTPPPPDRLGNALQNLRANIASTIMATLPPATGTIAVTLLTGDEQAIPPQERQNFIEAGLAHILAVAGLHVGIIMGLAFTASRWLLTRRERMALRLPTKSLAAAAALLAGLAYALLTGAHLPILRSLAMASLATLGVFVGRRAISLRGLALAALVLMLATPETVLGTSFQMSFSAVAALISGYAAVQHFFTRFHASQSRLGSVVMHIIGLAYTSLLAGGASMPFAAYQFQQIQPYWIPANILAVPLTAFWIMPLGLLSLALMPLHAAALALIPMGWGIWLIVWVTAHIATWPYALLRIAPMPSAAILLIAAGLAWLCIWRSPPRLAGVPLMAAGVVLAMLARPPDALVSANAKLIAMRSGPTVFLITQPRAGNFILEQWQNVWGETPLTPGQCNATACRLGPILFAPTRPLAGCGDAALALSPVQLLGACGHIPVIDRLSTYRNGATAAWITPHGVVLRTDRQVQGNRPLVLPYPQL
ncbi:MAG: ComEC/Rec2 family competence protein [Acidocella sp.]|nr:ComEC/Rec2 family competence protein [Acidocella sp.]